MRDPVSAITIYTVLLLLWGIVAYVILLFGISKWAQRWGRKPEGWVLLALFFTPIVASALLLMCGKNRDDSIITDEIISELKKYWRSQTQDIITVIKARLPLTIKDEPPGDAPTVDLEDSLSES